MMAHLFELFLNSFSSYVSESIDCSCKHCMARTDDGEGPRCLCRPSLSLKHNLWPKKAVHAIKFPLKYDFSVNQQVLLSDSSTKSVDEVCQNLVLESQNWPLRIQRSSISKHSVLIFLNRSHTFKEVLSTTSIQQADYGKHPCNNQNVILTPEINHQEDNMDLTQLRIHLVKRACFNMLTIMGYCVLENDSDSSIQATKLFITQKSVDLLGDCRRLLCGAVLNIEHKSKETQTKACDYYALRLEDMKTLFSHKFGDEVQFSIDSKEILTSLQDAEVKFDFLCIRPSHTFGVILNTTCVRNRVPNTKGASFVLYNYARISEIHKKYNTKVTEGYYPPLVAIEDVDFSLLIYEEEWELLFNFVLKYPMILEEATIGLVNGDLRPDFLCTFVSLMCSCFSVYYSRIKILTEPRQQLLPAMFARLYLLSSVQQVLSNALQLLDIVPLPQM